MWLVASEGVYVCGHGRVGEVDGAKQQRASWAWMRTGVKCNAESLEGFSQETKAGE